MSTNKKPNRITVIKEKGYKTATVYGVMSGEGQLLSTTPSSYKHTEMYTLVFPEFFNIRIAPKNKRALDIVLNKEVVFRITPMNSGKIVNISMAYDMYNYTYAFLKQQLKAKQYNAMEFICEVTVYGSTLVEVLQTSFDAQFKIDAYMNFHSSLYMRRPMHVNAFDFSEIYIVDNTRVNNSLINLQDQSRLNFAYEYGYKFLGDFKLLIEAKHNAVICGDILCGNINVYDNARVVVNDAYPNAVINLYDNASAVHGDYGMPNYILHNNARLKLGGNVSAKVKLTGFSVLYVPTLNNVKITEQNFFGLIVTAVVKAPSSPLTVYKKLRDNCIATLEVSDKFQCATWGKCRTESVKVIKITDKDGLDIQQGVSLFDNTFVYTVGAVVSTVYDNYVDTCSSGIHFFLTEEEAKNYML